MVNIEELNIKIERFGSRVANTPTKALERFVRREKVSKVYDAASAISLVTCGANITLFGVVNNWEEATYVGNAISAFGVWYGLAASRQISYSSEKYPESFPDKRYWTLVASIIGFGMTKVADNHDFSDVNPIDLDNLNRVKDFTLFSCYSLAAHLGFMSLADYSRYDN